MQDKPKLLDQVREKLRVKHYSIRTEQAYLDWIKRFILFHGKRHPETIGNREVSAFISGRIPIFPVMLSKAREGN
jgi:hypothetical protein